MADLLGFESVSPSLSKASVLQLVQGHTELETVLHSSVASRFVAVCTENQLFNALFGLLFWQELFVDDPSAIANEFDRKPFSLWENCFYQSVAEAIERRLTVLSEQKAARHLSKMASLYYGQPNGIFHWHSGLLALLNQFLRLAILVCVENFLRHMAKDYQALQDGYPDLMCGLGL